MILPGSDTSYLSEEHGEYWRKGAVRKWFRWHVGPSWNNNTYLVFCFQFSAFQTELPGVFPFHLDALVYCILSEHTRHISAAFSNSFRQIRKWLLFSFGWGNEPQPYWNSECTEERKVMFELLPVPSTSLSSKDQAFGVLNRGSGVLTLDPGPPGAPRDPGGPCQSNRGKIRHCITLINS